MSPKWTEKDQALLEKLRDIRNRKDLKPLPPNKYLRTHITTLEGDVVPFSFRYYQIQGILCMLAVKKMVLGDSTGTGKTAQAVGTMAYIWDKRPETKVLVVAPKSAIRQWASEIERFTQGVKVFVATAPKSKDGSAVESRAKTYKEWAKAEGPSVLILNYALLVRDWNHGGYQPLNEKGRPDPKKPVVPGLLDQICKDAGPNLMVVLDEATAFKSRRTKTWEVVAFLSNYANRAYALTATLLKNNLMEGYNIYKAIIPGLFGTQTAFFDKYCYVKLQSVGRGKQIPIVTGYKNLEDFRSKIELVFIGRQKHEISSELPTLTTREITCELSAAEAIKYKEALDGLLELGDGEMREYSETKALTSLIYCQEIVNSLALLGFEEGSEVTEWDDPRGIKVGALSSKEQALVDLLTEGELEDEKVIVYTRFERHVGRLVEVLKKNKIQSVRITGKENDRKRNEAQAAFQDLKSKVRVVFITAAGSEAINLQAASGMVFLDMPWSWGDYVQCLGRMIRIGSPHKGVQCYHLLAERPESGKDRKTIDHHVLKLLRKKKNLIDKVLGEAAIGALEFEDEGVSVKDLIRSMRGKDD